MDKSRGLNIDLAFAQTTNNSLIMTHPEEENSILQQLFVLYSRLVITIDN